MEATVNAAHPLPQLQLLQLLPQPQRNPLNVQEMVTDAIQTIWRDVLMESGFLSSLASTDAPKVTAFRPLQVLPLQLQLLPPQHSPPNAQEMVTDAIQTIWRGALTENGYLSNLVSTDALKATAFRQLQLLLQLQPPQQVLNLAIKPVAGQMSRAV